MWRLAWGGNDGDENARKRTVSRPRVPTVYLMLVNKLKSWVSYDVSKAGKL
jgi:hypothetical protein